MLQINFSNAKKYAAVHAVINNKSIIAALISSLSYLLSFF